MLYKLLFAFLLFIFPGIFNSTAASSFFTTDEVAMNKLSLIKFVGKMDVSMSKGKTFKDRPATFLIRDNKLYCDFPKIGKMPGKIIIDLPIQIHQDGSITAQPEAVAGVMKMPLGIKVHLKLMSLKDVKLSDDALHFTLSVCGKFLGATFPTTISFHGFQR